MTTHPTAGSQASNQFGTFAVHYATPAQMNFIASLFRTRRPESATPEVRAELNGLYDQAQLGALNKKAASRAIDLLLALPEAPKAPATTRTTDTTGYVVGATAKQVALIERLEKEREVPWAPAQVNEAMRTVKGASGYIEALFAAERRVSATAGPDATYAAGMYVAPDGRIFRAYLGQQSGQILSKEVVGSVEEGYSLEYRGMAAKHIPAGSRRMTLEEAKVWGKATGSCVKCGRRLDVPESVDAGIGPVCAGKEW